MYYTDHDLQRRYNLIKKTPAYRAERALAEVTEEMWKIGKPIGIYKVIYWLFEWCAEVLIWRRPEN